MSQSFSERAWRWRIPTFLSLVDQSVMSVATLGVNLVLARLAPPASYGSFAVAFSMLLFVAAAHNAILVDPVYVIGPTRHRDHLAGYARTVLRMNWSVSLILAAAVGTVLAFLRTHLGLDLKEVLALVVVTPGILSFWLLRTCCYLQTQPRVAVLGSLVYGATLSLLLLLEYGLGKLTASIALLDLGGGSVLGSATIFFSLGMAKVQRTSSMRVVLREHWNYGRWILSGAFAGGIAYGSAIPILGAVSSLEHAATLRAMQNFFLPLERLTTSLSMLIIPVLAERVAAHGFKYLRRTGTLLVVAIGSGAALYSIVVVHFGGLLIAWLYKNQFYKSEHVLGWTALTAVLIPIAQVLGVLVRAADAPRGILWSKLSAAIVFVAFGPVLIAHFGAMGAAMGLTCAAIADVIALFGALIVIRPKKTVELT
jgi:O-antigen/teichoic acid export membrane protein